MAPEEKRETQSRSESYPRNCESLRLLWVHVLRPRVQVGLLVAVIISLMVYVQLKFDKDASGKVNVPSVIYASEYILYSALLLVLGGGGCALIIRLASALDYWRFPCWVFYTFSPFVNWMTIFTSLCALGLLFLGVTLQLPGVVDALTPV